MNDRDLVDLVFDTKFCHFTVTKNSTNKIFYTHFVGAKLPNCVLLCSYEGVIASSLNAKSALNRYSLVASDIFDRILCCISFPP